MTLRLPLLGLAGLLTFTSGCAGSYTPIRPDRIATYQSVPAAGPIDLAYQFDVLRLTGKNKKYVKKEAKKNYRIAAVRLTNRSSQDINFSRDLNLYLGDRPVSSVAAPVAARDLRQGVPIYLLYALLNPTFSSSDDPTTSQIEGGTTIYMGPFIAGGNMIVASSANSNLRRELEAFDLTNRTIRPGETVYGIVSLRETAVAPLRVELRGTPAPSASPSRAPSGSSAGRTSSAPAPPSPS